MANEFNIKNGFISSGNGTINGTLTVTSISAATYYNLPPSGISGSGSTGQIAFFNSTSSLSGSSQLNWDTTNKRLGIVTSSPLAKLHVVSDDYGQDLFRVTYDAGSIDMINVKSGGYGTGTITFTSPDGVVCNSNLKMSYNNIIGATSSYIKLESPAGGNQSMYFKTSSASNDLGFQFLNSSDNQVFQITNGGNVGIGTSSTTEKLEVSGKTKTTTLQVTSGATNNYVLTSDANGNAIWMAPSGISGSGSTGYIPRWDSTTSVTNSPIFVYSVSAVTPTIFSAITASSPNGSAIDTINNRLYICQSNSNNVKVIDLTNYSTITTISVGSSPAAISFDSLNNRMYVCNYLSGTVSVISTASNTVTSTISVLGNPQGIAFDPVNNRMYVTKASNEVKVISTSSNTVIATIANGGVGDIVFDSFNNRLYSSNFFGSDIKVISTASNTIIATISVRAPGLAYDSTNKVVWAVNDSTNQLYKINTTSNTVTQTINTTGNNLDSVAYDSINNRVYTTSIINTDICIFDIDSNAILYTLNGGNYQHSITFDYVNAKMYVSNGTSNDISIINVGSKSYEYIGIGTTTPTEKMGISGNITVSGKTKTTSLQVTSGATNNYVLTSDDNGNASWQPSTITTLSSTTATIHFTGNTVFGTYSSPISSNLTDTLTNAKLGVVQKIYHNSGSAPTVPAGWVLLGSTTYQTSSVNIIYAEWSEGSRVEYWIVR